MTAFKMHSFANLTALLARLPPSHPAAEAAAPADLVS